MEGQKVVGIWYTKYLGITYTKLTRDVRIHIANISGADTLMLCFVASIMSCPMSAPNWSIVLVCMTLISKTKKLHQAPRNVPAQSCSIRYKQPTQAQ